MNLLITGGCGFIASNFINYYFNSNPSAKIINLDAMYYCASESNVSQKIRESDRYQFIKGNLCSTDLVNYILHNHNIDTVIHFAAQSHVQNSFSDSLQYTQDNILGTHTLLEACRLYGKIQKFIHISTDEVYGESMIQEGEEKKNENSMLPQKQQLNLLPNLIIILLKCQLLLHVVIMFMVPINIPKN